MFSVGGEGDGGVRAGVLRPPDVPGRHQGGDLGSDVLSPAHPPHHPPLPPDVFTRPPPDVPLPRPQPEAGGGDLQRLLCRPQPLHLPGDFPDQQTDPVQLDLSASRLQVRISPLTQSLASNLHLPSMDPSSLRIARALWWYYISKLVELCGEHGMVKYFQTKNVFTISILQTVCSSSFTRRTSSS